MISEAVEGVVFRRPLFGKEIVIVAYTPAKDEAMFILEEAYSEALRLQSIFNFYDKKSELSELNRKRKMRVSPELLHVIESALKVSQETGGKYDITLGKAIRARKSGENDIKLNTAYTDVEIDGDTISLKSEDAEIDLGSIAKGYITDKIAEYIWNAGLEDFIIDSRGDILFNGSRKQIVGIEHPREPGKAIAKIVVSDEAVATSGDYNQFYGSYERSHIINSGDVSSVSVIAKTLEEADAYATAAFVLDREGRKKIFEKNKMIKAVVIDKNMNVEKHNGPRMVENGN